MGLMELEYGLVHIGLNQLNMKTINFLGLMELLWIIQNGSQITQIIGKEMSFVFSAMETQMERNGMLMIVSVKVPIRLRILSVKVMGPCNVRLQLKVVLMVGYTIIKQTDVTRNLNKQVYHGQMPNTIA